MKYLIAIASLVVTTNVFAATDNVPKAYSYRLQWGESTVTASVLQGSVTSFGVQNERAEQTCNFEDALGSTRVAIQDIPAGASGFVAPISEDSAGVKTLVRFAVASAQVGKAQIVSKECNITEQSSHTAAVTKVVTLRSGEPQDIQLPDGSTLTIRVTAN